MTAHDRRIEVTAWLGDGAESLRCACADMDQIALTVVDTEADLISATGRSEVLVLSGGQYTPALADALREPASGVRWLQFASAGFDRAREHGVPDGLLLTNASTAFSSAVAEHAMALLLALTRCIPQADRLRNTSEWLRETFLPQLDTLEGRTMLIVGFGGIGQAVAARARAFGMRVEVVARTPPSPGADVTASYGLPQLHQALSVADVVVLAVALNDDTRHLIDADALAAMQVHARLINVARGGVVEEAALTDALREGRIAAAGLDVFEHEPLPANSPLRAMSNVVITPHTGGFGGTGVDRRLAHLVRDNLQRYARGESLMHRVAV